MHHEEEFIQDQPVPEKGGALKKIASCLGLSVGLAAVALAADYGVDKMQQHNLVSKTREKAELVAKTPIRGVREHKAYLENNTPCVLRSISDRELFQASGNREVEYRCGNAEVLCTPVTKADKSKRGKKADERADEYECKRMNHEKNVLRDL